MYVLTRAIVGSAIGIAAGVFFAVSIALLDDAQTPTSSFGGVPWMIIAAAIIGAIYVLAFEPLRADHFENVATGMVVGLIFWFGADLSLRPFLLGDGTNWEAADAFDEVPKLISYLLQGGFVGLVYGPIYHYLGKGLGLDPKAEPTPAIKTRVVVMGGGYAGVAAAQTLEAELGDNPEVSIVLVSQNNYLVHTPMLSEVSASAISAQNISPPLRSFFDKVQVVQGDIVDIDTTRRRLRLEGKQNSGRELPYDHLILAVGSVPNFFGNESVERHALGFKTLHDAVHLRDRVIEMFERADVEPDPAIRQRLLTFVVAGGGFAGVELLGGINDFARGISFYYRNVNPGDIRTVLVHSRDRILPELSEELGVFAQQKLAARGVEFLLNVRVTGARPGVVEIGDDEIETNTFVWTAGNRPGPITAKLGLELTGRGQIPVDAKLSVTGDGAEGLWAVGDCAQVPDLSAGPDDSGFSPPTAQHGLRQGKVAGHNVAAAIKGQPLKDFNFKSLGSLAALGHQLAVAEVFGRRFSGFFAWLLWRGIYLSKLPTLQKRVRVLSDWVLDVFFPPDIVNTIDLSQLDLDVDAHPDPATDTDTHAPDDQHATGAQ